MAATTNGIPDAQHTKAPASEPAAPPPASKAYQPATVEPRMLEKWDAAGAFTAHPERVLNGEARPYCILIPPPNVTGVLHLGHALNNTLQDILTRAHRMMGFEALWMPGTDHAGIATQAVVERRLMKEQGKKRKDYTREQFVALVQEWKDEYEKRITNQLKAMGCSCDFSRQRFTMDDICARAVREAFFRLFKDGLIYRGKRLVNWDPVLQTAVADDECYDEDVDSFFYYLRYPLVHAMEGKSSHGVRGTGVQPVTWNELASRGYPGADQHPGEQQAWVTVATTRPETYLGDTAVALNPKDPRAKALRGVFVELPIVGRVIPIIEDDYVVLPAAMWEDPEAAKSDPKAQFATGFLKVTPAHDPNDYDLGVKHKLPMINVMAPDGSISDKHGWSDPAETRSAHVFIGKSREEARKLVIAEFRSRNIGDSSGSTGGPAGVHLFEGQKPYRHSVKHSDRSKAIIEPYLSDQWFVKVTDDRLAGAANRALVAEQRTSSASVASGGTGVPPVSSASFSSGGTGVPPVNRQLSIRQRNLPHWESGGCTYLLTFRTAKGDPSPSERQITLDAAKHWHGQRMELHAAVVMPDHVHLLVSPFLKADDAWFTLAELLHSIKSFSAHAIAKQRGTQGPIWQDESHDRLIRTVEEFSEKLVYIGENPVRAGLAPSWHEYQFTTVSEHARRGDLEFSDRIRLPHRRDACATNTDPDSKPQTTASGDGSLRFYPSRYAKMYEQWHDGIRDWCISRQLWWGHRIPVWTIDLGIEAAQTDFARAKTLLDNAIRAAGQGDNVVDHVRALGAGSTVIEYCARTTTAGDVLDALVDILNEQGDYFTARFVRNEPLESIQTSFPHHIAVHTSLDPNLVWLRDKNEEGWTGRDPDVLDTWFSSALWPLSTLGWPDPAQSPQTKGLLEAFNPTSVLSTAREIITLWVSRMVMMNRYLMPPALDLGTPTLRMGSEDRHAERGGTQGSQGNGPVPFRDVFIHAVVQDGDGKRMSKSAGNGVDPLDIIDSHGADAMRFTLAQMTTNTQDVRMPVKPDPKSGKNTSEKFDAGRSFCNKLWNASTGVAIARLSKEPINIGSSTPANRTLVDRWMLSRLARATAACESCLKNYEFADYVQTLYQLLWWDFCDWYLEAIKPTVDASPEQRAVLRAALDVILRLLHPVIPFVTEAIFEQLAKLPTGSVAGVTLSSTRGDILCTAAWPKLDASLIDESAELEFERVRELVNTVRNVRSEHQVPPKRRITLHVSPSIAASLATSRGLIETLAGIESIVSTPPTSGTPAVAFRAIGEELHLSNLADAIDAGAEKDRLGKQLEQLRKNAGAISGRLNNPGYVDKAPPKLVEESKAQLAKINDEIAAIEGKLAKIG